MIFSGMVKQRRNRWLRECSISLLLVLGQSWYAIAEESPQELSDIPRMTQLRATGQIAGVVKQLPVEELLRLERLQQRFEKMPPSDQARLRQLHESLWEDSEAARLYRLLEQYRDWLSLLSPGQRDDLLSLPAKERVTAVARIKQGQDAKRFAEQSTELQEGDGAAVARWLGSFIDQRDAEIQSMLPERPKEHLAQIENPQRRRRMLMAALVKERLWHQISPPSPEELDQLIEQLSPSARERLLQVGEGPAQMALVTEWIRTSFHNRLRSIQITEAELNEYYTNELTPDEQESVDRLPAEQVHLELRRMFLERRRHRPPEGRDRADGRSGPHRRESRGRRPDGPGHEAHRDGRPGHEGGPPDGPPPDGFRRSRRRPNDRHESPPRFGS